MKKLFVVLAIIVLFNGCAAINQFLCNPTPAQIEAANVGKVVADTIISAASYYTGNAVVALISQNAIPVFNKVVSGYCVAQSEWDAAVGALQTANKQVNALAWNKSIKAVQTVKNFDTAMATLQAVRW
jgi:hypothetical protein